MDDIDPVFEEAFEKWRIRDPADFAPKVAISVQALHRQATLGDAPPQCDMYLDASGKARWTQWDRIRGMPKIVAKRRFISYLKSVDETLVPKVNPKQRKRTQPVDFCKDAKSGLPICAWCNSVAGCQLPFLDTRGDRQLNEDYAGKSHLRKISNFKSWYETYESNQRCRNGLHLPIATVEAKQFRVWFNRPDVKGFQAYDPAGKLLPIFDQIMKQHCEILYELQNRYQEAVKDRLDKHVIRDMRDELLDQTHLVEGFLKYYQEKTNRLFLFEVPCTRTSSQCHSRRIAAKGENHFHQIKFHRPDVDFTLYDKASSLRMDAIILGASAVTGPKPLGTKDRCIALEKRIKSFHDKRQKVEEASQSLLYREWCHQRHKKNINSFVDSYQRNLFENAIMHGDDTKMNHFLLSGAPPDYEARNGWTTLIWCTLMSKRTMMMSIVKAGASVDYCNKYGMTALMWACKREDLVMVHTLLNLGANAQFDSGNGSAISISVRGSKRQAIEMILQHLRDKTSNAKNFDKNQLLAKPLSLMGHCLFAICARHRMKSMARFLFESGSEMIRNGDDENAPHVAESYGWHDLAHFLCQQNEPNTNPLMRVNNAKEKEEELLRAGKFLHAIQSEDIESAIAIVKTGSVSPDYECPCGKTALISAVRSGNIGWVDALLKQGSDPSYSNQNGKTALMEAAKALRNGPEIAISLLKHNETCLNICDFNGDCALSYAGREDSDSARIITRLLLSCKKIGINNTLEIYNENPNAFDDSLETSFDAINLNDESWKWRLPSHRQD